jgi:hypothetical protein
MPKTYEPIATQALGTSTGTVTFSSIPSTYTDLVLVISGNAGAGTAAGLRFNGDSGTNYSVTWLLGDGSSGSSDKESNVTNIWAGSFYNTSTPTVSIINIMNYSNTTINKTVLSRYTYPIAFTAAAVGLWRNTSAINSVTVSTGANFNSGSTFTLYGIKAA